MRTYIHNGVRILYNSKAPTQFNMHKPHFHNEYELYFLTSGSRLFYINDKVYPLSGGSLAFVDGETMHRSFSDCNAPHTRFVICIKKSILEKRFPQIASAFCGGGCFLPDAQTQHIFRFLLGEICRECETENPLRDEALSSLVTKVFIEFYRLCKSSAVAVNSCPPEITDVVSYINAHYSEKFSLSDISVHCGISVSRLTRLFKAATGYTVVEFTNNLRIKKAAELIKSTRLSISEIALQTGFSSFSYFGKLFTGCYGISPLKYRNSV